MSVASIVYSKEVIDLIWRFICKRPDEDCLGEETIQVLNSLFRGNVDPATVKPYLSLKKRKAVDELEKVDRS